MTPPTKDLLTAFQRMPAQWMSEWFSLQAREETPRYVFTGYYDSNARFVKGTELFIPITRRMNDEDGKGAAARKIVRHWLRHHRPHKVITAEEVVDSLVPSTKHVLLVDNKVLATSEPIGMIYESPEGFGMYFEPKHVHAFRLPPSPPKVIRTRFEREVDPMMILDVTPGQVYRHFVKGTRYKVLMVATQESNLDRVVVYQKLDSIESPWVRPLSEFTGNVDGHPRFVLEEPPCP